MEGCKHQDNADIHYQPFPEVMPEEQQICANDNRYQCQNVRHHIGIPWRFNHRALDCQASLRSAHPRFLGNTALMK
jgi:hypothetical protein